jgi:hypothetical protein
VSIICDVRSTVTKICTAQIAQMLSEKVDKRMDGWKDGRMARGRGWIDGWMDECLNERMDG